MESSEEINVLISGAGIAGLSTAYWLTKYGFNVTIVERAPHIRPGGQALDVRGPALEVAARMGILNDIRDNRAALKGMSIIESDTGTEIFRSTERTMTGGKLDSADIEILRDDLSRVLFQTVSNQVKFIFNDTIVSVNQDETGVDITFANTAPQRFYLVIGADGVRSNLRRLVFGPDEQFIRYLGHYIGIFTMPNFLNLDHWELFVQHEGNLAAAIIVKDKDSQARAYLGFSAEKQVQYDYKDIAAQKQLIVERNANVGWEVPQILKYMQASPDFYFDSVNQVIMNNWSEGRVVMVGDAGYSVSLSLGQGTTIAMVGAYVLAGELAAHKHDFQVGLNNYENDLREYVETNQKLAYDSGADAQQEQGKSSGESDGPAPDAIPDFGLAVIPFTLKSY